MLQPILTCQPLTIPSFKTIKHTTTTAAPPRGNNARDRSGSSRSSSSGSYYSDDDGGDHRSASPGGGGGGGSGATSDAEDAEDYCKGGYHPVRVGEKFKGGRYAALRKLGWGHFSTVWLVLDAHTGGFAALKVQKSAPHYTEAARDEVTLLGQLRDGDPNDEHHCVRLLDHFEHLGPHGLHVCLVFEVLGDNLLALIKAYDYRGLPLRVVRRVARQVLDAVDYMHSRCGILHTDIKPENVMLVDTLAPRRWELELPGAGAAAGGAGGGGGGGGAAANGGGAGGSGGGGGGGAALTKNQKKKAKRKQAKAAAGGGGAGGGGGGDTASEATGATASEAAGAEDAVDGPSSSGAAANAGQQQQQQQQQAEEQKQEQQQQQQQQQQQEQEQGQQPPQEQPRRLVYESRVLRTTADLAGARAKVVDFGNACWLDKRFTDDVQTRQYRCPEVVLGAKWGAPADVWSVACLLFELATGDYLFEPKRGASWDR